MEIILKGVNFENVAVKQLGSGYKGDILGYADTEGNLQTSSSNIRTEVIPISSLFRSRGFVVLGSRHWTNNPAVVFYNSTEASQATFVDVFNDDIYNEHNFYVTPGDIPEDATHFIANGYKDNKLTVYGNFLDDIASDYGFTNGFVNDSNLYIEDSTWQCSRIIPIDNTVTYYTKYRRCATYNANLNFISLLAPKSLINTTTFNSDVKYVRFCALLSDGEIYIKY